MGFFTFSINTMASPKLLLKTLDQGAVHLHLTGLELDPSNISHNMQHSWFIDLFPLRIVSFTKLLHPIFFLCFLDFVIILLYSQDTGHRN